jgi:hypothetical protein
MNGILMLRPTPEDVFSGSYLCLGKAEAQI